jgi:hypothetical protein
MTIQWLFHGPHFQTHPVLRISPVPRTKGTPTSAVVHRPMVEHAFEDGDIDIETMGADYNGTYVYIYIYTHMVYCN